MSGLTLVTSLVDAITYENATGPTSTATASAILGPFFREDHPICEKGDTIHITRAPDAVDIYFYGRVVDGKTGIPIANAIVDVWQASTNGNCVLVEIHSVLVLMSLQDITSSKTRIRWNTTFGDSSSLILKVNMHFTASSQRHILCQPTDLQASS